MNLSKGNNNLQKTYNNSKRVGGSNMGGFLKKTFGVCLIGLGLGILMVLLLPITGWINYYWSGCNSGWLYLAGMLRGRYIK